MIVGTGVDLAEVPRVRHLVERYGRRFIERVYTSSEIAYVERKANRFERFAARFAAKRLLPSAKPWFLKSPYA